MRARWSRYSMGCAWPRVCFAWTQQALENLGLTSETLAIGTGERGGEGSRSPGSVTPKSKTAPGMWGGGGGEGDLSPKSVTPESKTAPGMWGPFPAFPGP